MKQTAVEWLGKELESYGDPQFCEIEWEQLDSLIQQAKEMEKEQLKKVWMDAQTDQCKQFSSNYSGITFDEYLEMYKKEKDYDTKK